MMSKKLKQLLKFIGQVLIITLLTVVTQIGGVPYLLAVTLVQKNAKKKRLKRLALFSLLYILATFLVVPLIAPTFGRERIRETDMVEAKSFFYKLANRNYVRPELNNAITDIAENLAARHSGIKLVYLDANFPFFDKFPLLPHLSHNDGRKIDISLMYEDQNGQLTNEKRSVSGYGVYEAPGPGEYDQVTVCTNRGNWHYDFPKYLTFGTINRELAFSKKGTADLIRFILKEPSVGKLFIEPHLKNRLGLTNKKVRYHGCQAVRHDDHIHFQLK